MAQIKNALDQETLVKVGKGALIAATAAAALFILDFIGALELENPFLVSFLAWFVPVVTNIVKEYRKGESIE